MIAFLVITKSMIHRMLPPLLSFGVLSFTLCLAFSHNVNKMYIVPCALFILGHLQLVLTHSHTFDEAHQNGLLAFIHSLGKQTFERFVHKKMMVACLHSIPMTTLLMMGVLALWTDASLSTIVYWGGMFFTTSFISVCLSFVISGIRLMTEHTGALSLFLIFPLLIPPLLFAQGGFEVFVSGAPFLDYFYLNCAVSLVVLSIGLTTTPLLLRYILSQ